MRKPLYLESDFRNELFSHAYVKSGGSLNALAKALGYSGRGRNGYVRNMWLGKLPVSKKKVHKIAELGGVKLSEVLSHVVEKEQNSELSDWMKSFKELVHKNDCV